MEESVRTGPNVSKMWAESTINYQYVWLIYKPDSHIAA